MQTTQLLTNILEYPKIQSPFPIKNSKQKQGIETLTHAPILENNIKQIKMLNKKAKLFTKPN